MKVLHKKCLDSYTQSHKVTQMCEEEEGLKAEEVDLDVEFRSRLYCYIISFYLGS